MAWATRPLPVPDSPVSRMVLLVGDTSRSSEDAEHRLAAADDVRELVRQPQRALEQDVLLLQLAVLDLRRAPSCLQEIDVERLAQVVAGAEPHRLDRASRSTRTP